MTRLKKLLSGWGHPHKGRSQHYFVPDRGTLLRGPDGTVVSLCGIWKVDPNLWWLPMELHSQPLSSVCGEYLQYPLCKKCAVKAGLTR